ncbi:MAG: MFS transporter, partial [Puniceicoccaceae bacterium]
RPMLITRKTKVPLTWAFYAQLIIVLSIYGKFVLNAPFLLLIKKYLDNPAAIMGLMSLEVYVTILGGPLIAWVSDRMWTRFGRRKIFVASSDFLKVFFLAAMPFAPNLWVLIALYWAFGIFGDLGSPSQALIWEVVPAKQRGISAGFMKAFMNIGNLVFFTLLLGRFHDVYFLGPFQFLGTISGATLMFLLCALLFLGAAVFEWWGVKETYPPGHKRMSDGRRPGQNVLVYFVKSVFGDIFAKDIFPLYMLLFANVMFGFSLGVFQPLLFTEQWGYDLQMFGNTVAIGIPVGIALGLLGGWMADRYGKMTLVFWATIGNLVVNIIYTVYVYFLPDFRPSFWEIVLFGNAAYIFGSIKGVASGPLLWEYVKRNRMGAATGGVMVFNSVFRTTAALLVGGWLFLWALWFFPQAGYNVVGTFGTEKSQEEVVSLLQQGGVDTENLVFRPVHQYGVDGETSQRWWVHRESDEAAELLAEKKDLVNKIDALRGRKVWILTPDEEKASIEAEIKQAQDRVAAIEADLKDRARRLHAEMKPLLENALYRPGEQLLDARWEDGRLSLTAETIEQVREEDLEGLRSSFRGPEQVLVAETDEEGRIRFAPDIEMEILPDREGGDPAFRYEFAVDPRYYALFEGAYGAGLRPDRASGFAAVVTATGQSLFGRGQDAFSAEVVESGYLEVLPVEEDAESDPGGGGRLVFRLVSSESPELAPGDEMAKTLKVSDSMFHRVEAERLENPAGYRISAIIKSGDENEADRAYAEVEPRMADMLGDDGVRRAFAMVAFRKMAETLASRPVYVTVPQYEVEADFSEREYEYFFSSQLLQIGTDVLGIGILLLIIYLEKRGTIHRYGAEEDDNR